MHAQLCGYNSRYKCLIIHIVSALQEIGDWAMLFKCILDKKRLPQGLLPDMEVWHLIKS